MTMQTSAPPQATGPQDSLRNVAIEQLRKKRGLQAHVLAYVMVNLFLNALYFFSDPGGFYWPMFPMFGWGIGLVFHIWDVVSPADLSEEKIQREIQRLTK